MSLQQSVAHTSSQGVLTSGDEQEWTIGGILNSGIQDGILYFEVDWLPDAETVAPFDLTWEPFWNLSSQSILYDRYRKWRSYPQDDAKFDAADEAASNPHLAYFKEGYMKLVEMVADEVLDHGALDDVFFDPKTVARAADQIVISLPRPVLQAVCGASLRARKVQDEDMYAWLTNNLRKSDQRPSIYMIEFTDRRGRFVRVKKMREIVRVVRAYISPKSPADSDLAVEIDLVGEKQGLVSDHEQDIRDNSRRKFIRSAKGLERLEEFLDEVDNQIAAILAKDPNDEHRMPFVLRDIGYSGVGEKRLEQHLDLGTSANPVMALFAAAASVRGMPYALHAKYSFLGFRREHAARSEVLFSIFAQSYTSTGKGFHSVRAGGSKRTNSSVFGEDWNKYQADVLANSPMEVNAHLKRQRTEHLEREVFDLERRTVIEQLKALVAVAANVDVITRYQSTP